MGGGLVGDGSTGYLIVNYRQFELMGLALENGATMVNDETPAFIGDFIIK